MCQLLNLGHLETTKSNFKKKIVSPGLKKLSWKKGGLAVGEATLHCEKARK